MELTEHKAAFAHRITLTANMKGASLRVIFLKPSDGFFTGKEREE